MFTAEIVYFPAGRLKPKVPGLWAKIVSDSPLLVPVIFNLVSVAVWLAATTVTSSGAFDLIGGAGCCSFWGISWVGSCPTPISVGCTVSCFGLIVTLTRRETCGRCSLAWRDSPQPTSSAAPTKAPTVSALALPGPIGAEFNRRGGRLLQP